MLYINKECKMAKKELFIGNLNCIFLKGIKKYDFLDFWDEYICNIFNETKSTQKDFELLLKDIHFINILKEPIITGRFVKKSLLIINQKIENDTLLPANEVHRTAPSSVFVYLLKNHILLYIGEHRGYPSVKTFTSFLSKRITKERSKYIKLKTKNLSSDEKAIFVESTPPPFITYIPVSHESRIENEFSNIIKIKQIKIRQYLQNGNFSTNTFMRSNSALMDAVKGEKVDTTLTSVGDVNGVKEVIKEISSETEAEFVVRAETKDGIKDITNEGIKYKQSINFKTSNELVIAEKMIESYHDDIKSKLIPNIKQKVSNEKLKKVKYE